MSEPILPPHRPIFIVGANGTGTTLLRLMLDSHERIAIPHETGFLRLAAAHKFVPYWERGDSWAKRLDLKSRDVEQHLAMLYGEMFRAYAASRGKMRWGDKTPFHVWHLQLAARMYPDLQVVGIVRHPGAVVVSQRRRFRRRTDGATTHWKRSTKRLLQDAALLGDRVAVLRYEDLVSSPDDVMRPLLEWLDEPWSPSVLAHHEVQGIAEVEGFTRADIPINASHVAEWQRHLHGSALADVIERTSNLANFLGYDASTAKQASGWGDRHPFVLGSEIAERQQQDSSSIDWSRRVRPPVADRPLRPPAPKRRERAEVVDLTKVRIVDLVRARLVERARLRRFAVGQIASGVPDPSSTDSSDRINETNRQIRY